MRGRSQFHQILVSIHVLDQNDEMSRRFTDGGWRFIKTASWRNIKLAADDGFDTIGLSLFVKINNAEHIAVVRNGDGGHAIFFGLLKEVMKANHAVEEAVLRMDMKMNKIRLASCGFNQSSNSALLW